jgi:hypothetical protein
MLAPPAPSPPPDDALASSWKGLVAALRATWLYRHKWEWVSGMWLPYYRYLPVHTISEVWTVWSSGLDGNLPVREVGAKVTEECPWPEDGE